MTASTSPLRILYCHCAFARVVPGDVKAAVLDQLSAAAIEFEAVPDLCEMSARRDPRIAALAATPGLRIAACFPRAVRGLFEAAGSPLAEDTSVLNMRTQAAPDVVESLLAETAG
ncbi:MAG: hypothetical protein HYX27_00105 [Acidobacteria bacterium]|nr:hypothetical protein [Acidobacteriota bacterium]